MQIKTILNSLIEDALKSIGVEDSSSQVTEATKPEFGDYQFNGAMGLAKKLRE